MFTYDVLVLYIPHIRNGDGGNYLLYGIENIMCLSHAL